MGRCKLKVILTASYLSFNIQKLFLFGIFVRIGWVKRGRDHDGGTRFSTGRKWISTEVIVSSEVEGGYVRCAVQTGK